MAPAAERLWRTRASWTAWSQRGASPATSWSGSRSRSDRRWAHGPLPASEKLFTNSASALASWACSAPRPRRTPLQSWRRGPGGLPARPAREPREPQPETSERVEWTDTRNLPTSRGDRAAAVMAATAEAAPELNRMAGGSAVGRKLEKPVCHYSLNWAPDETPDRGQEPECAGAGEAPGADRGTRPLRSRCASDRRPVGRSESAAEGSSDDEALRELSPPRASRGATRGLGRPRRAGGEGPRVPRRPRRTSRTSRRADGRALRAPGARRSRPRPTP